MLVAVEQLWYICNAVDGCKAHTERARRVGVVLLGPSHQFSESVQVTAVIPLAFLGVLAAISERSVVPNCQFVFGEVEAHRAGVARVVRILDQLVRDRGCSAEVPQCVGEDVQVVDASRQVCSTASDLLWH